MFSLSWVGHKPECESDLESELQSELESELGSELESDSESMSDCVAWWAGSPGHRRPALAAWQC